MTICFSSLWGGFKYLRIMKLILLLFKGLSGLTINFHKNCLYSTTPRRTPIEADSFTFNCGASLLPVTYLGMPISRRSLRWQDWLCLKHAIHDQLATWKVQFLSLGSHFILVNSILSSIPTYWMTMLELPKWVRCKINRILTNFLYNRRDLTKPKCHLGKHLQNKELRNFGRPEHERL